MVLNNLRLVNYTEVNAFYNSKNTDGLYTPVQLQ